jgi:hypothetical protein
MTEDDLEPVDLEPVDLEPDDGSRVERARDRRPAWIWVGLVGAGLAAWGAIALTTRGGHARPAPATPTSAPLVDRLAVLTPRLRTGLQALGSDRFAAVIDDRLYVVDEARPEASLVQLPEGHVTIADQSGPSLLASTFEQTLVSTQPISTRTLSPRDVAIRAVAPGRWWLLHDDGTVRLDHRSEFERVPSGLRVVAAVRDGFVALDTRSAWVLWSHSTVRPIATLGAQLLTTGPRTIAFKNNCGYSGCALEIVDLARGTFTTVQLSRVPEFAAFSPDGTRLALATTLADVYIIDAKTGAEIARTHSRNAPSPSLPFTWTPDGRALLVVQDHDVEIVHASDGLGTSLIAGTDASNSSSPSPDPEPSP